ncbi:MAG TPA: ABC transporter ATP-binding protein [Xanthobacteraceae bacterium]|nr:ABC transporter ATP-binding protein [Xanthobacteraceae bacterium]
MSALLEAREVSISYGKIEAARQVSLTVEPNQIVTVIGPNGAGKSSLLRALMGALPHSGTVRYAGIDWSTRALEDRVDAGLYLVPEERALFTDLTVDENLVLGAFRRRHEGSRALAAAQSEVYDLFPRLKERSRQLAGTLSGGERQMLALGRALMGRPKLLMLDEPSLGLAPRIVREVFRTIIGLRERGVSLLVVEQNARAALQIADYGYVIEQGRVVLEGPAAALQADDRVVSSYLGGHAGADAQS